MQNKYPALRTVSSFFKFISVIVFLAGLVASLWPMLQGHRDQWSTMLVVLGILGSVILAVIFYAFSDFLRCIMDIEANTRSRDKTLPPQT